MRHRAQTKTVLSLFWMLVCFLLVGQTVQAAAPLVTDDAGLLDAKSCQVETWVQNNRDSTEYWALPACNVTGNLDLTLGAGRIKFDGGGRSTDVVLQGKTLFKTLEPNGWAWGLVAGNIHRSELHDGKLIGDLYAYVPVTFSFRDDRVLLHANLGWKREREPKDHFITWGLASELRLSERVWVFGEMFGQSQNQGRPFYQAGFRFWLVPDRIQLDTSYGNRFGVNKEDRWFYIGLRLLSPAFLP